MEKSSIIARGDSIQPDDLPSQVRNPAREVSETENTQLTGNLKQILEETERQVIENTLRSVNGNKTAACKDPRNSPDIPLR